MGPGALSARTPEDPWDRRAEGLSQIGAAISGIVNPAQANAINNSILLNKKAAKETGTWSSHVMPNGQVMQTHSLTGQTRMLNGNYAAPPDPKDAKEDPYVKKYKEEDAKGMVDLSSKLSEAASNAQDQNITVGQLRTVLSNPNLHQGITGPMRQAVNKVFADLGFGDASQIADGDIAGALSNKLALQLVNNNGTKLLPGSFSDSDRKFVEKMSTNLSNDPKANQRLLDIYERNNKRVMEAETLRQEVATANNGVIPSGFRGELGKLRKKWMDEDSTRDAADAAAAKASAPPAAAPKPTGGKRPPLSTFF
jgi:hypothetical protein